MVEQSVGKWENVLREGEVCSGTGKKNFASIYFNVPNRIASSISNYIHEIQYRRTLYTIANQYKA